MFSGHIIIILQSDIITTYVLVIVLYLTRCVLYQLSGFSAHIFFDDAMEPDDNDEQVPNRWVKELVACMDIACRYCKIILLSV